MWCAILFLLINLEVNMNNKFTIEQIEQMDGHVELIGGELIIQQFTSPLHNSVVLEIACTVYNYIISHKDNCHVFRENVALYVNELLEEAKEFYLPDVMIISDSHGISENGVHVAPIFVAEVTSEESKIWENNIKLETYRKIGVEEYWIIDLPEKKVCKYLASKDYVPQYYDNPSSMNISVYHNLSIDLSEFMQ